MHNIHRRVLVVLPFFAAAALLPSSAYALTYTTYTLQNQNDVIHSPPGGAVETVYGYNFFAYVTVPTQVPPSTAYTITISKTLSDWTSWWCKNTNDGSNPSSGVNNTGCGSSNVGMNTITFNGNSLGYFGYGSDSVTYNVTSSGVAGGSDTVSGGLKPAAGWSYGSNIFGDPQNNYFYNMNWSVSVPIVAPPAPPSVNLWFN